jgi:hypothetical protein
LIRSDEGEGRIVFCDGLVQAAYLKGEPEDLRGLLVLSGCVSSEEFYRAEQLAEERGAPLGQIIPEFTSLSQERLESLIREHVEHAVFQIFAWTGGEFSFEVREQIDVRDRGILMPTGINAQFLTMEATRLGDEGGRSEEEQEDAADDSPSPATNEDPIFSGEGESEEAPVCDQPSQSDEPQVASETPEPADDSCEPEPDAVVPELREVVALAAARQEAPGPELEATADPKPVAVPRVDGPACLIAIDPDLSILEWEKATLADLFPRVHIFQSSESGVARIRQYLSRGAIPVVMVSIDLPSDPMSAGEGVSGFIRRLKLLAPSMPVLVASCEESEVPIDAADAVVSAPPARFLVNRHDAGRLQEVGVALRAEIEVWLENSATRPSQPSRAPVAPTEASSEELRRLRVLSERMRDPVMQGETLSLVLDFAAESFSRVAMFMVRDEVAVGIAQRGLSDDGGPNDDEFRQLEVPTRDVEWFSRVLESESALRSAPTGDGDRALALRIGRQIPTESYVAPITSGGRVVALLYTDNVPAEKPIGDTTILEIALHEAGLALERALLERARSQAADTPEG